MVIWVNCRDADQSTGADLPPEAANASSKTRSQHHTDVEEGNGETSGVAVGQLGRSRSGGDVMVAVESKKFSGLPDTEPGVEPTTLHHGFSAELWDTMSIKTEFCF